MDFTVLSHAGLAVTHGDVQLLCDPWVVGSTYWRSWWNYPPVPPELVASLQPTHIYLTHIHWDHFQSASLKKFPRDTPIIVPRGPYDRMGRDLRSIGFTNVEELAHGSTLSLGSGVSITSYQFGLFLDSAVVVECDGVTILNANDAKIMGGPLRHLLDRHPDIDFVLRSHSSANSRLCYEVTDRPDDPVDDSSAYTDSFAAFAQRTGARYAIPFASNHCFLHRDVFDLNDTIQTPLDVKEHFATRGIASPEVRIMTPGDTWSNVGGFHGEEQVDFFERRDVHLKAYVEDKADKLDDFYRREERATVRLSQMERYFADLCDAVPRPVRRHYRGHPVTWVLWSGDCAAAFELRVDEGTVRSLEDYDDERNPLQIHTSAYIMVRCMARDLFSHLPISKRVRYRVSAAEKRYVQLLNLLFNLYEYDMLPLRRNLSRRSLGAWAPRWRELLLYGRISVELARRRSLDPQRYI